MKRTTRGRGKPRPIPDVLTPDEQARLLAALNRKSLFPAASNSSSNKLRALCIVRLMLKAGLRSAELVSLRWQDLDWSSGKLRVNGKGQRDRLVWLSGKDRALLLEYRGSSSSSSNLIFQTGRGKPIDTRFLRAMMERLGHQVGIERLHPHLLRHTFATDLYKKTKDILLVQRALGHVNLATTEIYTHIYDPQLEAAMKELGEL
jgi:integrase/recombinase XerD